MRRSSAILLLLALVTTAAVARWDAYVERTLRSVIEANEAKLQGEAAQLFTLDGFPTRARVVYDGQLRPIPALRLAFIAQYMSTVKGKPEMARTFASEILCSEGNAKHWLPIQGPLVSRIGKEIAPGDPLDIYVTLVGANKKGGETDWVFTINEFVTVPAEPK